jgi:hypothetical protein
MKLIEFEDVPHGRFYVTEDARIWDAHRHRWLTQTRAPLPGGKPGYVSVGFWLSDVGKIKRKYVHRLVAWAYVPNPESKPEINHRDGDKTNNLPANLEWCTKSENHLHAHRAGLKVSLPKWLR